MKDLDKIKDIYQQRAEESGRELTRVQRQIRHISLLRLLLFAAGVAGLIAFRHEGGAVLAGIAGCTLVPFLLLVKHHNRLFARKDHAAQLREVNLQELAALQHDTSAFEDGQEFAHPAHLYAPDLDVFGPHSLFQYLNRTCTQPGRQCLARWMGQHLEEREAILQRQEAVHRLTPEIDFRQQFRTVGLLHKGQRADADELNVWAAAPAVFRTHRLLRMLPAVVTGINAACAVLVAAELMIRAAEKYGVVTQMGNQGHSEANYFQFKAWTEAGPLSQVFCLGAIAQRLNTRLQFDPRTRQITNNPTANRMLTDTPPRKGWEAFYKL